MTDGVGSAIVLPSPTTVPFWDKSETPRRIALRDSKPELSTEVTVDVANGLSGPSVVSCDNITTVPADTLGAQIGVLLDAQEGALADAIRAAFDLD